MRPPVPQLGIVMGDPIDHYGLPRRGEFRKDRQAQHFRRGSLGFRQAARAVSERFEALLQVQRTG